MTEDEALFETELRLGGTLRELPEEVARQVLAMGCEVLAVTHHLPGDPDHHITLSLRAPCGATVRETWRCGAVYWVWLDRVIQKV